MGYVVPQSFTHGTSEQRMQWFNRGVETGDFSQCDTFRKGCSFSFIILGMTPVLQVSLKVFLYFAQRRAGQFKCSSILFTDHFKQNIVVSACHFSDATRV